VWPVIAAVHDASSRVSTLLMAVPNVSEGRDASAVRAISRAFAAGEEEVKLLDVHSDADHHRSVYTLAGPPAALSDALLRGARKAVSRIDVMADASEPRGEHPHVGALDVAPVVYLDASSRGAAFAEALVLADRIGDELAVPVFLYGELAGGRTRAQLRSGGVARLAQRIAAGELRPDFGPPRLHPSAGATLVAARAPLVAFNLRLVPPASVADARRIASLIREGGSAGLPGLRAIGVRLAGDIAQVSINVERPYDVPLALVIERVRAHAAIASGELVGLAPRAALAGFPDDVSLPGFDPARHVIERALGLEPG
jgi:glutamate formiminotransferase/glutamate formiminotransferase/formiminotetrahydrofolate cyclodeaminase